MFKVSIGANYLWDPEVTFQNTVTDDKALFYTLEREVGLTNVCVDRRQFVHTMHLAQLLSLHPVIHIAKTGPL